MNLLLKAKEKIAGLKWAKGVLAAVLLPLTLFAFFLKLKKTIQSLPEDWLQKNTDKKDKEIETKTAKEEGKLELLGEEKQKAVSKAESQDPVSFHNSRKK